MALSSGDLTGALAFPRLPTLPGVALEIIELMRDSDVKIAELAETISQDPALAAKVLRVANSSFYAQSRTISSIRQAIVLLGLNNVQSLALSFSLVDGLRSMRGAGLDRERFWRRSLITGTAARHLARRLDHLHTEEAFVTGLLCRIGILALSSSIPDEYAPVLADAQEDYERLSAVELDRLGFTHIDAGARLAELWNLPESLATTVRHIDDAEQAPAELSRFTSMIGLADRAAAALCSDAPERVGRYRMLADRWFEIARPEADQLLMATDEAGRAVLPLFEIQSGSFPPAAEILTRANEALAEVNARISVENAQLRLENDSLERRATTDSLTGLANRTHFDHFAREQVRIAERYGTPLSLLFLDLDGFKAVNDTLGHQAGDGVLRQVGDRLRSSARSADLVARFGGDEFAIVMPATTLDEARAAGERIRNTIADETIAVAADRQIAISVSVGIATFQLDTDDLDSLIARADRAVYEAKRLGGNRATVEHREAA